MEKVEQLKNLILRLHGGEDESVVQEAFRKAFGHVSSREIAQMEAKLIAEGIKVEEIQSLCSIHARVFEGQVEDTVNVQRIEDEWGHPLFVFRKENEGLQSYLQNVVYPAREAFRRMPSVELGEALLFAMSGLQKLDRHYARKENLFFPYLEKAGITGPPQVMWGVDDEIRAMLKDIQSTESGDHALLDLVDSALAEITAMIKKENEILSPLLLQAVTHEDWLQIAEDSPTIGFAFNGGIEGASPSDAVQWALERKFKVPAAGIQDETHSEGVISLPSGELRIEQLIHMLNTSPQDFTYIDAEDKVRYFSEGKHPVFPRTRTIIGRDVRHCHPPKAQEVVNQLLIDFKAGTKDEEVRVVLAGPRILLIRYYAVRSEEGEYLGTLETTEEISSIVEEVKRLSEQLC